MSFNGSGTFQINTAGQPVVTGTVISSTAFNALTADLATGLSTCITKDGQTTPTANIPMGSNKITGLANGTVATDAATLGQVQSSTAKLLSSVSGTNTITAAGSPAISAYAAGQMFYFVSAGANTGAVTLNIDSLGAKNITKDGTTALISGDITSGEVVVVVYDGTRFQMVSPSPPVFGAGTAAAPSITTSGDTDTGIFFPAANTIAVSTNGVERTRVDSAGSVGIGGTPNAYDKVLITGNLPTDSTVSYALNVEGTFTSGATSLACVHRTFPSAASVTAAEVDHFFAVNTQKSGGASITSHIGFGVGPGFLAGTNNYAFYGGIGAASNRWNFYAGGTARNYFAGGVEVVSGTTGMTSGFTHIPAAAGAPTGAPTNPTGNVPMYYDSTNHKIYVYSGGTWRSTAALT